MARVRRRPRADGGTSYQVVWVLGGGRSGMGRDQAETFTSEARALQFKEEVEAAGHQWPTDRNGVQWRKGEGYVRPHAEPVAEIPTFGQVAERYFDYQAKMVKLGHLSAYMLHRYRRSYVLHLSTAFGDLPFTEIQAGDIEDWMVDQRDLPSSGKSIRNRHGLLFSILSYGQKRMRLRPDNPAELTRLPKKDNEAGRQIRFFQHGEWALFRACLRSDVHLLVDIALATGMRWGELSALRVGDLEFPDEQTARIRIVRAWSKRSPDDEAPIKAAECENKSWKLGPPKSKRSRYVVVRGDDASRLSQATKHRSPSSYVFVTRSGTPWRYPDFTVIAGCQHEPRPRSAA
jgi:integrase